MHKNSAARCHFAALRRRVLMATTRVPHILARSGEEGRSGSLAVDLAWTLRARELTTFSLAAFSLASSCFNSRTTFVASAPATFAAAGAAARMRSCAERQIGAMLCEAFGLGRLASAGHGLGWQSLTSKPSRRRIKKMFLGKAGLQRLPGHSQTGRWRCPELGASNGSNLNLPGRRPLPKTANFDGAREQLLCWMCRGYLNVRFEYARRTRPWRH